MSTPLAPLVLSAALLGALEPVSSHERDAGVGRSSRQDKVTLKIATVAPEGSTWMRVLEEVKKKIYLRTRGRVSLKFFSGGSAGEERTVLEKSRYGQLQGAALTGAGMGSIFSPCRVMELPFYFEDYRDYDHVLAQLLPEFERGFEQNGFVLLGWAEAGFANLFSRTPLRSLEDLRASKVWLRTGDPMIESVLRVLELQSVPLSLPDVLTSIQTGLVETVYVSPLAVVALQWFPHLRYAFHSPLFNIQASLVVDAEVFRSLSSADQDTVRRLTREGVAELVTATRRDNAESETVLREKGIEFLEPTPEQKEEFHAMRIAIARALTGELFDAELLARFEALVAEARALRLGNAEQGVGEGGR